MREQLEGLFLSAHPYTDSSVIVQLFTNNYGRRSFIFKGARKKNSPYIFQPLHFIEFNSSFKNEKSINTASNQQLAFPCHQITSDIRKTSIAFFLTEILNSLLKEGDDSKELYHYIKNSFLLFEIHPFSPEFHLVFLTQILSFLGVEPKNNLSVDNPYFNIKLAQFVSSKENYTLNKTDSYLFSKLLGTTIDKYTSITFNKETRNNMLEILFEYFEYHFHFKAKQISSHKIFKTIFS
jgi:DNA repair protein RecO (recombination protein O)